jgi:uncharacterized membrane protein
VRRHLSRLGRQPFWFVLAGAILVGTIGGNLMAGQQTNEAAEAVFGQAWRADAKDTRTALTSLLGLQLTVLTIVLSLNAPMIQSAANQYSPRLVPFYLSNAPLRWAIPAFVLSAGFILAGVRRVGHTEQDVVQPRVVLSVAVILAELAFGLLMIVMIRTFRFMRVERILGLVRASTFGTIQRVAARARRLPLDPGATLPLPGDAVPLTARRSGYLIDVDARGLARQARRAGVRVRISRTVGDYFDEGEVVGWVTGDRSRPIDERLSRRLAAKLAVAPTRQADADPLYGIRILSDVAARAMSSSANDAYTARQALQNLRSLLRRLARAPSGDWNVMDPDGTVRVSVMATQLREFLSVAVEAPLRYGAGDPEILDGVLEIALEVGLAAGDADGRAAARQLISRVLDDAIQYGHLGDGRLKRLLAEADLVRASLEGDSPRPDRHARATWALTSSDIDSEAQATAGGIDPQ